MPSSTVELPTASDLRASIVNREVSAREVVADSLDRIRAMDPVVKAFVYVDDRGAMRRAAELDQALVDGCAPGVLHGLPVAIKCLTDHHEGWPATSGCRALAKNISAETSPHVQALIDAGAIVLGTTNTSEFGHQLVTDNPVHGPTLTPSMAGRNAGGSSGGSAAAVASGMVALALGSDAAGSIRVPAAWCGVLGLKPSFGLVPQAARPNAFLIHTPFVHTGPIARTASDAALLLQVLRSAPTQDPFAWPAQPAPPSSGELGPFSGSVGVCLDLGGFPVENDIHRGLLQVVRSIDNSGVSLEALTVRWPLDVAEINALWRRQMGFLFAGVVEDLRRGGQDLLADAARSQVSASFLEMVERGRSLTVEQLHRDAAARTTVFDAVETALAGHKLMVTATVGTRPFVQSAGGATAPPSIAGVAVDGDVGWTLTHPFNLTGHPAVSLPVGEMEDGAPLSLQIIGRRGSDELVLGFAALVEQVLARGRDSDAAGPAQQPLVGRHDVPRS